MVGCIDVIVYFSSVSGNTERFVEKLNLPSVRIPLRRGDDNVNVEKPSVLILPTYGAGPATKAVPKQVIKYLNIKQNRDMIRGVIGTGNTNFGEAYGLAADIVAKKLGVPVLYKLEIFGTPEDVDNVRAGIPRFLKEVV